MSLFSLDLLFEQPPMMKLIKFIDGKLFEYLSNSNILAKYGVRDWLLGESAYQQKNSRTEIDAIRAVR
jgi:hypothetical protein